MMHHTQMSALTIMVTMVAAAADKKQKIVPVTGAPYATLNTVLAGILFDK